MIFDHVLIDKNKTWKVIDFLKQTWYARTFKKSLVLFFSFLVSTEGLSCLRLGRCSCCAVATVYICLAAYSCRRSSSRDAASLSSGQQSARLLDVQLSICNIKHLHRGPHEWAAQQAARGARGGCVGVQVRRGPILLPAWAGIGSRHSGVPRR